MLVLPVGCHRGALKLSDQNWAKNINILFIIVLLEILKYEDFRFHFCLTSFYQHIYVTMYMIYDIYPKYESTRAPSFD
jgi:hypothetical protein